MKKLIGIILLLHVIPLITWVIGPLFGASSLTSFLYGYKIDAVIVGIFIFISVFIYCFLPKNKKTFDKTTGTIGNPVKSKWAIKLEEMQKMQAERKNH